MPRRVAVPFSFRPLLLPASLLAGVSPGRAELVIGTHALHARFGWWRVTTPLENVESVEVTGPYQWWRVAGGPRLSLADGGITFATTTAGGLCVGFREPVALDPVRVVRIPSLTVTPADPRAAAEELEAAIRRVS